MQIAYIDDSGSDSKSQVVVVGCVVVDDTDFRIIHFKANQIRESLEALIPRGKKFDEFKATALIGGYEAFEGVPLEDRMQVVRSLLQLVRDHSIPVLYAAVDRGRLAEGPFGSCDPVDVAFRMCISGVLPKVVRHPKRGDPKSIGEFMERMFMVVMDDTQNKSLKDRLRSTFESLRARAVVEPQTTFGLQPLMMCHDDMYFGDSKRSIGLQLADVCANIVLKRLRNDHEDELFGLIKPQLECSRPQPEWDQCKAFMLAHDA